MASLDFLASLDYLTLRVNKRLESLAFLVTQTFDPVQLDPIKKSLESDSGLWAKTLLKLLESESDLYSISSMLTGYEMLVLSVLSIKPEQIDPSSLPPEIAKIILQISLDLMQKTQQERLESLLNWGNQLEAPMKLCIQTMRKTI